MKLREQLAAKVARARQIAVGAKARGGQFTDAEIREIDQLKADTDDLRTRLKHVDDTDAAIQRMAASDGDAADLDAGPYRFGGGRAKARAVDPLTKAAMQKLGPSSADPYGEKALAPSGTLTLPVDVAAVAEARPDYSLVPLLSRGELDGTSRFTFLRQGPRGGGGAGNAAVVPVGATKPTTQITLGRVDGEAVTIAHLSEAIPRQDLADFGALQQFIGEELAYGIQRATDRMIVNGSGTAPEPAGVLTTTGVLAQPYLVDAAGAELLRTCRAALTRLAVAGETATGFVLHPTDWERVETQLDAQDRFQLGGAPQQASSRTLWGVPVVLSIDVPVGTAIVGDWRTVMLFVREAIRLDWSESGPDLFSRNQVMFRCETRVGLALARPSALCTVDLTAA